MTNPAPYEPRVPVEDAFDATIGFVVDESEEVGLCAGHLPVRPGVCQPMGIVHGGVYAAIAETLASMGTARGVLADGRVPLGMSNNTSFLRPVSEGTVHGVGVAIHRGRMSWVWDVEMRDDKGRLCATSRVTIAVRDHGPEMNKIRLGFFSFTEVTDPNEHHSYNEWHQLDHMPEQYPLDGIAYGQRWVSTPACRAAHAVSEPLLDPIHYMTLYLMTEPVDRTLREFMQLGRDLHAVERFHLHRKARLSGPFPFRAADVAPRVLISAEAVPYRPNRGVYVEVEEIAGDEAVDPTDHLGALCAVPGVAGAWSFADDERRVTVTWLDAPPLDLCEPLAPIVARRRAASPGRTVFAGPLETITPWQWDWFDRD